MLKAGFNHAFAMGPVGVITGAIAGWAGLLTRDGANQVADVSAPFYFTLIALFPAAFFFYVWANVDPEVGDGPELYASPRRTYQMLLPAAAIGAIVGSFFFFLLASIIPVIFGGEDTMEVRLALWRRLEIWQFLLVFAALMVTAFYSANWVIKEANKLQENPE